MDAKTEISELYGGNYCCSMTEEGQLFEKMVICNCIPRQELMVFNGRNLLMVQLNGKFGVGEHFRSGYCRCINDVS